MELATVSGTAVLAALALFGIAYAVGGEDATSDNWVGVLVALLGLGGLLGSAAAFVLAIVATREHGLRRALWLPLALFPALALLLVLGEAFWWE
ncbi:MAG TPA: hypothetical protein VNJ53_00550 [Gaiellaceae bacterium]|nr:hypothetical protein [Gaiellaceae bacterium]